MNGNLQDSESIATPRTGPLPVTVLCGFLGSGKTTLLKRLLRESEGRRFGIIVNDLSELAVDAELIGEAREGHRDKLVNLNRGSLGGALREKFRAALDEFSEDGTTDYLLIETSGGTQPTVIVEDLTTRPGVRLDTFATVVDGLSLLRDHDCGCALLAPSEPASPRALFLAQIAPASVLLISKADLLTRAQAEDIIAVLLQLNPRATIITMAYGSVDAKYLLDARTFHLRKNTSAATADDPEQFDLGSDVLADPRPFHPARLHALFTQRLPLGLHRSKGWLWLASRPKDVFVWNQSGSHLGLEWAATWKAAILEDKAAPFTPEEMAGLAESVASAHPIFGDRACELTLIGTASDRAIFLEELHACFCTEEEIAAWQRGDEFPDPWPKTTRKV